MPSACQNGCDSGRGSWRNTSRMAPAIFLFFAAAINATVVQRCTLLLIARHGEDARVLADDGTFLDVAAGRRRRADDLAAQFARRQRQALGMARWCVDAHRDMLAPTLRLLEFWSAHFHLHHLRAVVALVGARQDARARAAWDPVALQQRIAQWIAQYGDNAAATTAAVESVIRAVALLANIHPSYVRAAANRSGQYGDLVDVYELVRQGMAMELRQRIETLRAAVIADGDAAPPSVRMAPALLAAQADRLLVVHVFATSDALRADAGVWAAMQGEWGGGPGYRDRVVNHLNLWLRAHADVVALDMAALIGTVAAAVVAPAPLPDAVVPALAALNLGPAA